MFTQGMLFALCFFRRAALRFSRQVIIGWLGMGLTELVNLNVLRIFRVIRLLRAGRLLIIVPELYILVSGLATSMKAGYQELTGENWFLMFGLWLIETSDISHEIAFFIVQPQFFFF